MITFVHDWQELIGALISALIAGGFVLFQVWRGGLSERRLRRSRYTASRASVLFMLSRLIRYCKSCSDVLRDIYSHRQGERIPSGIVHVSFPDLPDSAVAKLASLIELSPDMVSEETARLLADMQVQRARLESLEADLPISATRTHIVVVANIEAYIIDTAKIYARVAKMFPLARFEIETLERNLTWDEVTAALISLGFDEEEFGRLYETVTRRRFHQRVP